MSGCKIDHSFEDVKEKFQQQEEFLEASLVPLFEDFFQKEHTQNILNEIFHLLKKYDLASDEEKAERTNKLQIILKNL